VLVYILYVCQTSRTPRRKCLPDSKEIERTIHAVQELIKEILNTLAATPTEEHLSEGL
jgi:hypothetical protein